MGALKNEVQHFTAAPADEVAEKDTAVPAGDSRAEAIAKLDSELLRVERESDKRFAEPCIDYLKKRCGEDAGICEDILQVHKTWKKCHSYIMAQARKELNNTSGPVRSDVVFEWAEDYFHLDDKALEEKRTREDAERKKRQEESKKQPAKGKQKAAAKKPEPGKLAGQPSGKQAEKLPPKKKAKEMEGQLDLFSMMGL